MFFKQSTFCSSSIFLFVLLAHALSSQEMLPLKLNQLRNELYAENKIKAVYKINATGGRSDTLVTKTYDQLGWILKVDSFIAKTPSGISTKQIIEYTYSISFPTKLTIDNYIYQKTIPSSEYIVKEKSRYIYVFDSIGLVVQYSLMFTGDTIHRITYLYNESGKCQGYIQLQYGSLRKFIYYYNYQNNCIHFVDSAFRNNNRTQCLNSLNQITSDSTRLLSEFYFYDDYNRLIKKSVIYDERFSLGPYENDNTVEYFYHKKSNRLLKQKITYGNSTTIETCYSYSKANLLLKITGKDYSIEYKYQYY